MLHCAGARTESSLSSFDHVFRPDYIAFLRGFGLPVRAKLRSKRSVRTFWPLAHRLAPAGQHDGRFPTALSPRADLLGQKIAFR